MVDPIACLFKGLFKLEAAHVELPHVVVLQIFVADGLGWLLGNLRFHNRALSVQRLVDGLRDHAPALHEVQGYAAIQSLRMQIKSLQRIIGQIRPRVSDGIFIVIGILEECRILALLIRERSLDGFDIVGRRIPERAADAVGLHVLQFLRLRAQLGNALQQFVGLLQQVFLELLTLVDDVIFRCFDRRFIGLVNI